MNLPQVLQKIDDIEFDERRPLTEELLQKIGSNINALIDIVDSQPSVGSIEASFLTEAQYQSIRGTNWILCDGRDVSGSRYHAITGRSTIPDLRGLFIRMKNHSSGRTDELNLGEYQNEAIGNHKHSIGLTTPGIGSAKFVPYSNAFFRAHMTGTNYPVGLPLQHAESLPVYSTTTGTTHSGPRHVICNWFIRIN